jgi:hypothetical protein
MYSLILAVKNKICLDCLALNVQDGTVHYSDGQQDAANHSIGTEATFTCDPGFAATGQANVNCSQTVIKPLTIGWNGTLGQCTGNNLLK